MRPDEIVKLHLLKLFAENNPFHHEALQKVRSGEDMPIGQRMEYRCSISSYTVVFTINEDPADGWFRHLSISWMGVIQPPPLTALIQQIMDNLGFCDKLHQQKYVKMDAGVIIPRFPVPIDSVNIQELIL